MKQVLEVVVAFALIVLISTVAATFVTDAHAAGFDNVATAIDKISAAMRGPVAKAVATLAICIVGYMWMVGQMDAMRAMGIVGGIGVVMASAELAALFPTSA